MNVWSLEAKNPAISGRARLPGCLRPSCSLFRCLWSVCLGIVVLRSQSAVSKYVHYAATRDCFM